MLSRKSRRYLSVLCLTIISVLFLSALVFASPDVYISHPAAPHDVSGLSVTTPNNAFDNDTTTKAWTSYARSGGYGGPGWFQVRNFDGNIPFGSAASEIKIVIYYKSTLPSGDAEYKISYLKDYTVPGSEVTYKSWGADAVDYTTTPYENLTACSGLTLADVPKMSVRFTTRDPRGGDTGGMLYIHEIWISITYTAAEVHVHPPTKTVSTSFTIDVNVTNIEWLYAWEFKLYYDTTMLTATGVSEGTFLSAAGKCTKFVQIEVNDAYSATQGRVWAACTIYGNTPCPPSTGDVWGVNGSGTLATVSFDLDGPSGVSTLDLQDTKLVGYDKPASSIFVIPHPARDGQVTVSAVPEFPLGFALEIAIIPIIVYIFLKTRRKIKHHNNPPTSPKL